MRKPFRLSFVGTILLSIATSANAALITFNDLEHGTIVNSQYAVSHGLNIYAENTGGGPDLAIIFDSSHSNNRDPDLVGPGAETWDGGNLAPDTTLGKLLIIAENSADKNEDGLIDNPDDEGSRPAGSLFFEFDSPISEFGFDLVDVELAETGNDSGYVATFYSGSDQAASVKFSDFIDPLSAYYDPTVVYGDNFANHIAPIQAASLGLLSFDKVEVNFGGSAAIDNIYWDRPGINAEIPVPATIWMFGIGLFLLLGVFYMPKSRKEDELS